MAAALVIVVLTGLATACGDAGVTATSEREPFATPVTAAERPLAQQTSGPIDFFAPVAPAELATCVVDADCMLRPRTCFGVCCGFFSDTNVIAVATDKWLLYGLRVCRNVPSSCYTCWVEEPNLIAVCTDGHCRVAGGA